MRLALEVTRTPDLEALRSTRRVYHYRLWARVRFQTTTGWSEPHRALIDTGAPYSLVPLSLWPALATRHPHDQSIAGIVPGETAQLNAVLAQVFAQLLDERGRSPRLALWAMLAESDRVPLIVGWAGCLDRATLIVHGRRRLAWLEF